MLNLLNADWGRVWEVDPIVPILDFVDRAGGAPLGRPRLGYSGTARRDPETSQLEPRLPHYLVLPASQWQAQVGFRVSF